LEIFDDLRDSGAEVEDCAGPTEDLAQGRDFNVWGGGGVWGVVGQVGAVEVGEVEA
jgi:hypothetical protein